MVERARGRGRGPLVSLPIFRHADLNAYMELIYGCVEKPYESIGLLKFIIEQPTLILHISNSYY